MSSTVIIGSQWGDEGKGKIVDALSGQFDIICRFNGGNNAGHTVIYKGERCKLHILPCGLFHKKKLIIAQGMVFDPEILITELDLCRKYKLSPDLLIDARTNLVMPYHKLMDGANEVWKGKQATGSVKVGIGYCYEDRNNRSGIRCEDLFYPQILKEKISRNFLFKKEVLEKVYGVHVSDSVESIYNRLIFISKRLKPFIGDTSSYLLKNLNKKKILFEGAMGTMLDGQFGTYPYAVANNTILASLFTSLGLPPFKVKVFGVVKAYTTRVGEGPFPTEQKNKNGDLLQYIGKEIAATSGRTRRCGWLDFNIVRYAHKLNHFDNLILTKLDVLSQFAKIPICISYKLNKRTIYEYPSISHDYYHCQPIYVKLEGWKSDISNIQNFNQLPKAAKNYIKFIEKELKVPIKYISTGADRESLISI